MLLINLTEGYEMAHALEINALGKAKMAYADREIPWHRLGKPMAGLQTAEAMLVAAQADFDVALTKVIAVDDDLNPLRNPDGSPVFIEDSRATVRLNPDGTIDGLSTVGTRFVVQQNKDCLDRALAIVGASAGDALVDTCGVLNDGREFFACLDLGSLIIDPNGINDKIQRYLLVRNGHDGKTAITYANTSIRAVCKNTVVAGQKTASAVFTARHTRNAEAAIEDATEVLKLSTVWASNFNIVATQLLSVPILAGSSQLDKVVNTVFPHRKDETDRQKKNIEEIHTLVRGLYVNSKNAGGYGFNGWSMYNAIGEYLDHYRDAKPNERAIASMDINSWVTRKKIEAQQTILALV
jgi:phage/plasmid-like protein (TIGR03299 family)